MKVLEFQFSKFFCCDTRGSHGDLGTICNCGFQFYVVKEEAWAVHCVQILNAFVAKVDLIERETGGLVSCMIYFLQLVRIRRRPSFLQELQVKELAVELVVLELFKLVLVSASFVFAEDLELVVFLLVFDEGGERDDCTILSNLDIVK